MKNELDEQLKKKWESASVTDFKVSFDTEALWNKINRPKPRKKIGIVLIKYAVAALVGALFTFGLVQLNHKEQPFVSSDSKSTMNEPIARHKADTSTTQDQYLAVEPQTKTTNFPVKKMNRVEKIILTDKAERELPITQTTIEPAIKSNRETQDTITHYVVAAPTQTQTKTVHLSDLEKGTPNSTVTKSNNIMQIFQERSLQAQNDIALSSKIIDKLF